MTRRAGCVVSSRGRWPPAGVRGAYSARRRILSKTVQGYSGLVGRPECWTRRPAARLSPPPLPLPGEAWFARATVEGLHAHEPVCRRMRHIVGGCGKEAMSWQTPD